MSTVRRVWKFVLRKPQQLVEMPAGARLLHVAQDPASLNPAVWAEVDSLAELQVRRLAVVMTGEPFDAKGLTYVGTARITELGIIAHVYEAAP
jgi:hypothetical protein